MLEIRQQGKLKYDASVSLIQKTSPIGRPSREAHEQWKAAKLMVLKQKNTLFNELKTLFK